MSTGSDLENTSIEYIDKLEARSKTLGSKTAGVLSSAVERELRELRGGYDKLLSSGGKDGSYTTAQAAARIQNTIDDLGSLVSPKEINRLNQLYKDEVARASQLGKQAGLDLSNTLNGNDTLKKNARANRRAIEAAGRRLEQFWGNENQLFKDRVTALTQTALAQGKSYRQLALQVRELLIRDQHQSASSQAKNKRYGIKGRADLIARTELQSAFIGGSIDRFRQRGVEWVRWSAAAERTCPFCMSRDSLIYELDEVESDIPAHPRCRCTLLPSHKPKDWKGNPNQKKDATDQLDDAYWAKSRAKKLEQWKKEHLQRKPNDKQDLNALLRRYMDTPTNSRRRLLGTDKAPKPQWMPSGSFVPDLGAIVAAISRATDQKKKDAAEEGNYQALSAVALKALAKEQGIRGYSKMRKADLVSALEGKNQPQKLNNAKAVAKAKHALTNAPERNELQTLRNRQHDLDWKIEGLEIQERDGTIKKGGTEIRKLRLERVNNKKRIDVLDKKMEKYYDAMLDAELLGSKTKALTPAQVNRMKTHESSWADQLVKQGKAKYNYRLPLEETYSQHKGFHDRPELTKDAQSWWDRTDLITDKTSGLNKPFFRGVSSTDFRDTFQGKGKNGGTHYGGKGIYGNGTYAATPVTSHWDDIWKAATEAEGYSYSAGVKSPDRMTMFGLKKGTRILELDSSSDKPAWTEDSFRRTAQRRLKNDVCQDVGELAAALGYDAAIVKKSAGDWDQDFWIVFNRSKVVAVEGGMAKNFPEQVGQGAQGGQEGVKVKKPKSQKKLDYTNTDAVVAELQRFNSEAPDTLNRILDLPIIATPHETQAALKADKPMAKDLSKTLKKNLKELEKSGADEHAIDAYAELTELVDMMTL